MAEINYQKKPVRERVGTLYRSVVYCEGKTFFNAMDVLDEVFHKRSLLANTILSALSLRESTGLSGIKSFVNTLLYAAGQINIADYLGLSYEAVFGNIYEPSGTLRIALNPSNQIIANRIRYDLDKLSGVERQLSEKSTQMSTFLANLNINAYSDKLISAIYKIVSENPADIIFAIRMLGARNNPFSLYISTGESGLFYAIDPFNLIPEENKVNTLYRNKLIKNVEGKVTSLADYINSEIASDKKNGWNILLSMLYYENIDRIAELVTPDDLNLFIEDIVLHNKSLVKLMPLDFSNCSKNSIANAIRLVTVFKNNINNLHTDPRFRVPQGHLQILGAKLYEMQELLSFMGNDHATDTMFDIKFSLKKEIK